MATKEQLEVTVREQQLEIERLRAEKEGLYLSSIHQDLWRRSTQDRPNTFEVPAAAPALTKEQALEGALAEAEAAAASKPQGE